MRLLYADTSVIVRAYVPDEPDHARARALLLESGERVVTSELTQVELASAVRAAARAARTRDWRGLLGQVEKDMGGDGPLTLLSFEPQTVLPRAYDLVLEYRLRALDAIHLAVALEQGTVLAGDGELVFVTRDADQAAAAAALGLAVE